MLPEEAETAEIDLAMEDDVPLSEDVRKALEYMDWISTTKAGIIAGGLDWN